MLRCLILLFAMPACILRGQDKLFFLNGEHTRGKVLELGLEEVVYLKGLDTLRVPRYNLMFIEYEKGRTEIINRPVWDVTYNTGSSTIHPQKKVLTMEQNPNQVYINTLSLFNADISVYYEYILQSRSLGLGCFGTYNFNTFAGIPNAFIGVLSNGKKLYDAGIYFTAYARESGNYLLFYGMMLKYTEFVYSAAQLDTVYQNNTVSVLVNYSPAKGHQISPLFHTGVHANISESLFIKTSFSLGFFHMSKTYSQQFNYAVSSPGETPGDIRFLIKGGIGIGVGFKF